MAERTAEAPSSLGVRLGVPLAGAVALTGLLRSLYPASLIEAALFDPAAVAGVCVAGQLWFANRALAPGLTTRRSLEQLFGLANSLTLLRGALYAVVAGFVVVDPGRELAWAPALAYGAGVTLDKVDGTVARTLGSETALGQRLDMAFDTFGFVVAPLLAVLWGRLPVWYLSLSTGRYVYRGGIAWRRLRGTPVFDAPDSDLGRYLAAVQMAFLTAALAPAVPAGVVWTLAPVVLAPSLAVFARDYLVVSGRRPR